MADSSQPTAGWEQSLVRVSTEAGARLVLFADAAGLHRAIESGSQVEVDTALAGPKELERLVASQRPDSVVICDSTPTDPSQWASMRGPEFEACAVELAHAFVQVWAPTYRYLSALGVSPIIHAGLGDAASTLRAAATRVCSSMGRSQDEFDRVTTWVLRHNVFFVALSKSAVTERLLPRHFQSAAATRNRSLDVLATLKRLEHVGR